MNSNEFSLVFGQRLTGADHLHYGFWKKGETPKISALFEAQERYAEVLADTVKQCTRGKKAPRLLDVGTGTGAMLCKLTAAGYMVDGVVPSEYLYAEMKRRLKTLKKVSLKRQDFLCRFEELPQHKLRHKYDLVYYSESFQYLRMADALPLLREILAPNAKVVICDFSTAPKQESQSNLTAAICCRIFTKKSRRRASRSYPTAISPKT